MSPRKTVQWAVVVVAALFATGQLSGQTPATPAAAPASASPEVDFPVVIRFSEQFLSLLISPEVNSQESVDTVVLGTRATGTAWTNGTLHLDLKPETRGVALELCFDGTCVAQTVARNGPAILHNTATTKFSARKILSVDVEHGIVDQVATISAKASVPLPCIESTLPRIRGRIVRRVAQRRARRVHRQVVAIARNNAEDRIRRSFNGAVERLAARYNDDLGLLRPVIRRLRNENPKSSLVFSTTEDHLQMSVGRADSQRTPQLPDSDFDRSPIQIWLHRSALGEGDATAREHLARFRLYRSELETQFAERFRSRDAAFDLLRSVPIILRTVEEWLVIGLPSADEQPIAVND